MADLQDKLDQMTQRTATFATAEKSPFEACQKMRARKRCPGYRYYPETDSEAFFCSPHCSCWMRIRDYMLKRTPGERSAED